MSLILDGGNGVTFPNGSNPQAAPSKVLQVVSAATSTQVSTSSNSYTDTGLTATITPLFSTSKILVMVQQQGCYKNTNDTSVNLKLQRNGSDTGGFFGRFVAGTGSTAGNVVGGTGTDWLDSPATTSAVTYKTQFASDSNNAAAYVQFSAGGNTCYSTMILMEIAQ